ncbi:hypothetical protein FE257_010963 [Aspergillus nanangensis]|uniref:SMP domain-containing protein n=1 Tax=Aspergillus nanangensis TaxID=2582783 RepID=A0AAD4GY83_ASPNN|nr:hypothetical protein FE257_010963 [Aspergillus nanangensis]
MQSVAGLEHAAQSHQRITVKDASYPRERESEPTDGSTATAQSLATRRMDFNAKLDEISSKPQIYITHEDARQIQAAEGRAFNKPPGAGSISAQVRSIADRNESLGFLEHPTAEPVHVTKEGGRKSQHMESFPPMQLEDVCGASD